MKITLNCEYRKIEDLSYFHNDFSRIFLLWLFILFLLLTKPIMLFMAAIFPNCDTSLLLYCKEFYVAVLFSFILVSRRRFKFDQFDMMAWALIFICVFEMTLNVRYPQHALFKLKMYTFPIMLFLIGKHFFNNVNYAWLKKIYILSSIIILFFGILFYVIFLINENIFVDVNIGKIFLDKDQNILINMGDPLKKGLPGFFYAYYEKINIKRAFGNFLDPLTTGFFLVPIIFFFRYNLKKRKTFFNYFIYFLLVIFLFCTITRSIILGYIFTCFAVKFNRGNIKILSLKFIFIFIIAIIGIIIINFEYFKNVADPSSYGHLIAYYHLLSFYKGNGLIPFLYGNEFSPDRPFGNESLFTSMIFHNGIVYFLIFILFVYIIIIRLIKNISLKTEENLIFLSSIIVYVLASFTTEHWFATTSCGHFWLFLGIIMGKYQENNGILTKICNYRPPQYNVSVK